MSANYSGAAALPANIGIYEKSHDCAERVTAIVYNLMRNGVPFKRVNPQLVSSQYFSIKSRALPTFARFYLTKNIKSA